MRIGPGRPIPLARLWRAARERGTHREAGSRPVAMGEERRRRKGGEDGVCWPLLDLSSDGGWGSSSLATASEKKDG